MLSPTSLAASDCRDSRYEALRYARFFGLSVRTVTYHKDTAWDQILYPAIHHLHAALKELKLASGGLTHKTSPAVPAARASCLHHPQSGCPGRKDLSDLALSLAQCLLSALWC